MGSSVAAAGMLPRLTTLSRLNNHSNYHYLDAFMYHKIGMRFISYLLSTVVTTFAIWTRNSHLKFLLF